MTISPIAIPVPTTFETLPEDLSVNVAVGMYDSLIVAVSEGENGISLGLGLGLGVLLVLGVGVVEAVGAGDGEAEDVHVGVGDKVSVGTGVGEYVAATQSMRLKKMSSVGSRPVK